MQIQVGVSRHSTAKTYSAKIYVIADTVRAMGPSGIDYIHHRCHHCHMRGVPEMLQWVIGLVGRGMEALDIAKALSERYRLSEDEAEQFVRDAYSRLPSLYPSYAERVAVARLQAASAVRLVWDEIDRARRDRDAGSGTTSGATIARLIGHLISAQRHLDDVSGVTGPQQVWADRRQIEALRAGAQAQIAMRISELSDSELISEVRQLGYQIVESTGE